MANHCAILGSFSWETTPFCYFFWPRALTVANKRSSVTPPIVFSSPWLKVCMEKKLRAFSFQLISVEKVNGYSARHWLVYCLYNGEWGNPALSCSLQRPSKHFLAPFYWAILMRKKFNQFWS